MPRRTLRKPKTLETELREAQQEILRYARAYGLDPIRTVFELIDHDEMNEVAAFGGFPTRYPHWRFGMEYEELQKGYTYGLQKIYELVINN
ncbi:MAG: SpoVR family protein, partial [Planctomycetes bacterium]|nr:SpoVR family protein [Planctomycetota bacterium]